MSMSLFEQTQADKCKGELGRPEEAGGSARASLGSSGLRWAPAMIIIIIMILLLLLLMLMAGRRRAPRLAGYLEVHHAWGEQAKGPSPPVPRP